VFVFYVSLGAALKVDVIPRRFAISSDTYWMPLLPFRRCDYLIEGEAWPEPPILAPVHARSIIDMAKPCCTSFLGSRPCIIQYEQPIEELKCPIRDRAIRAVQLAVKFEQVKHDVLLRSLSCITSLPVLRSLLVGRSNVVSRMQN
jgi:hypothetical protein